MITLRPYQEESISKILWAQKLEGNDLVSLPTASGKSVILAKLAERINKESVILCPNREILDQNKEKLGHYIPEDQIGVYSASFKRKDINKYNLVTIQSAYKVPELFKNIDQIFVDECHLVNQKNKNGMLSSFIKEVGSPKVIGVTATPFRNVVGYSTDEYGNKVATTVVKLINRMHPFFWNRLIYNLNTSDLLEQGYISPLKYESRTFVQSYKIPTNRSKSDFDLTAFTKLLTPFEGQIADEINRLSKERHAVLVFCSSVGQAHRLAAIMNNGEVVTGETPIKERARIIEEFKQNKIKIVFNVGVLTTGFDFPALDTIVLLRPTRSLNLYQQMLGRLLRLADGKTHGLVVDFSDTVSKLGKVEDIHIVKEAGKWELYANNEKWHNKPLFSFTIEKNPPPSMGLRFGGKRF